MRQAQCTAALPLLTQLLQLLVMMPRSEQQRLRLRRRKLRTSPALPQLGEDEREASPVWYGSEGLRRNNQGWTRVRLILNVL